MKVISDFIPDSQYIPIPHGKQQIVLHHTVSSNAKSPRNSWLSTPDRVATPYIVDKDGTIYQLFDPSCWAFHIGKGSNTLHNQRSIGIEIVNEGILTKNPDGTFNWTFGKFNGGVYEHNAAWRGSKYFAKYSYEQIVSVAELCKKLCAQFKINKRVLLGFNYAPENLNYVGIVAHHNLRPDKSDVSPAFDYELFTKALQ